MEAWEDQLAVHMLRTEGSPWRDQSISTDAGDNLWGRRYYTLMADKTASAGHLARLITPDIK
eukprot:9049206-Prorocentrum_lima.AAC.1